MAHPNLQISLEMGDTDDSVIVKKVFDPSKYSKKNQAVITEKLPEVTLHLFSHEDIDNLRELEKEIIAESYNDTKEEPLLERIKKFFLKL